MGDRADTLISPAEQLRTIEAYASGRGFDLNVLNPELDVSGAKARRPILDAALERIDDCVVAAAHQRLAQSVIES